MPKISLRLVGRLISLLLAGFWLVEIPWLLAGVMASGMTGNYALFIACAALPILALIAAIGCLVGAIWGKFPITLTSSTLPFFGAIAVLAVTSLA